MTVRYNLACILSLASAGKDAPNAEAKPVDGKEAQRLRDLAFSHLGHALELGWTDASALEKDPDLLPLHTDPHWTEILRRLAK